MICIAIMRLINLLSYIEWKTTGSIRKKSSGVYMEELVKQASKISKTNSKTSSKK
jgi:hypothetical protein